ncbi:MAG TPA: hypothetical protein VLF90_01420 [Patescibacteria group bacterium]|nr:hypothetical protein [Patescibacteria group bacterium]
MSKEATKTPVVEPATIREVNGKPVMHIKVYSPFKVYFDGDGFSITAVNDTGPFDILPRHHNFMTLLNPCDVVVNPLNGSEQKFPITRGVMHVKSDKVIVFLDV